MLNYPHNNLTCAVGRLLPDAAYDSTHNGKLMLSIHREKLLKLADHLETVPEEKFNMNKWHCGTQSCALGHACTIFPQLELRNTAEGGYVGHVGTEDINYAAAAAVFGNYERDDTSMVYALFSPNHYHLGHTKADVIAKMRRFCAF